MSSKKMIPLLSLSLLLGSALAFQQPMRPQHINTGTTKVRSSIPQTLDIPSTPLHEEVIAPSVSEMEPVTPIKKKLSLKTWKRRLNTKEDQFSVHKISSAAFVVSSTVILGGMLMPTEQGFFQEVPSWLSPFDAIFTLSTSVQALAAIPMILKHRKVDPKVGKTQIEMGLASTVLVVFSTWESPFCPSLLEDHWKTIFSLLIVSLIVMDFSAAVTDYDEIQDRMTYIGVSKPTNIIEQALHQLCFRGQFILGCGLNVVFIVNFLNPALDRADWLHLIETGYGLPFCSGADMPLIYFSTVLSSVVVSYQSLLATLANKKLIPADTATNVMVLQVSSFAAGVIFAALFQLLFARSRYG
ncbi:unknown protein [Seminavis robusta]|uniref:Uncharacterized protein n=1 Tax=Seminavis robusta TaxID=568900 RepID=A0A9N8D461_9STRA|nr:unknown protein [Seminavis robusta]|eukprot:Sro1_g000470.1 n/a (356) ;mRNA; f:143342-144409